MRENQSGAQPVRGRGLRGEAGHALLIMSFALAMVSLGAQSVLMGHFRPQGQLIKDQFAAEVARSKLLSVLNDRSAWEKTIHQNLFQCPCEEGQKKPFQLLDSEGNPVNVQSLSSAATPNRNASSGHEKKGERPSRQRPLEYELTWEPLCSGGDCTQVTQGFITAAIKTDHIKSNQNLEDFRIVLVKPIR